VQSVGHVVRRLLIRVVGPLLAVVTEKTPAVSAQLTEAPLPADHHRSTLRLFGVCRFVLGINLVADDVAVARPRLVAVATRWRYRYTDRNVKVNESASVCIQGGYRRYSDVAV